eukprot:6197824-Pleurochrysis_carterae.AAC.1
MSLVVVRLTSVQRGNCCLHSQNPYKQSGMACTATLTKSRTTLSAYKSPKCLGFRIHLYGSRRICPCPKIANHPEANCYREARHSKKGHVIFKLALKLSRKDLMDSQITS